jgi:starch synthase
VTCLDAELYGMDRHLTALRAFVPDRRRWAMRFRLGPKGFAARSAKAQRLVDAHVAGRDVVMQFGATFQVAVPKGVAHVLYCDSNFEYSRDGSETGYSEAAALREKDAQGVMAREAAIYAAVDRIFTLSERVRRAFIERFAVPAERVEAVFAGANFAIGQEPEVPADRGPFEPVILFAGRAFERKGGSLLLEAFRMVRERIPAARLVVMGPDELPGGAPPPEGVELLGFVNKATPEGRAAFESAYARARVFCLPTRFEAFGIVYLEAMHYELPCVGPRQWAVPEIIEDGVTGLLHEPEDARSLADALAAILGDPARAREMGLAGKRRLAERFTWRRVVRRMVEAIAALPGVGRRAAG